MLLISKKKIHDVYMMLSVNKHLQI